MRPVIGFRSPFFVRILIRVPFWEEPFREESFREEPFWEEFLSEESKRERNSKVFASRFVFGENFRLTSAVCVARISRHIALPFWTGQLVIFGNGRRRERLSTVNIPLQSIGAGDGVTPGGWRLRSPHGTGAS